MDSVPCQEVVCLGSDYYGTAELAEGPSCRFGVLMADAESLQQLPDGDVFGIEVSRLVLPQVNCHFDLKGRAADVLGWTGGGGLMWGGFFGFWGKPNEVVNLVACAVRMEHREKGEVLVILEFRAVLVDEIDGVLASEGDSEHHRQRGRDGGLWRCCWGRRLIACSQ